MSSTDTDTNINTCSPPKKRVKRSHLNIGEKNMILNIYKSESLANPELVVNEIMKSVASKTGVSSRTVCRIVSEYKSNHELSEPKTNRNRKPYVLDSIDDFDKEAIRRIVHQFYFRNEFPTIDKVLEVVNQNSDLPNFKRTTFYKLLKSLNFEYKKRGRNSMLMDREEIVLWRRDYLKKIKTYRNEGRTIYYLDETWVNVGHTVSKDWIDNTVQSSKQAFLSGLSTGLKNPSGKGQRLIVCHIGNEDGFVSDSLWAFQSKKSNDYHEEMDGKSFEKWFSNVLPKLDKNAVIVLDNAPYHSRKIEKIPTSTSKKADIQNWLVSKNISFDEDMLKVELLAIIKSCKKEYNKYIVDEMAKSQGKTVLRLPPYHCELNPIELIWAQIKNYVASKNTTFKFADMENLFHEALKTITPEQWQKCIDHVQAKVEKQMWELDNIMEQNVEPIIINLNDDSSSDSSDSSD